MRPVEERLAAAFRARADLVTYDGAPPAQPRPERHSRRWPHAVLAAAAAVAAFGGGAVLLSHGPQGREPANPQPTATDIGADWPVLETVDEVDVTGDGTADHVVVRREPAPGARARVELAGASAAVVVHGRGLTRGGFLDLDRSPGAEITLYETAGKTRRLHVITYRGDRLTEAAFDPDGAPLATGTDDAGRRLGWEIDGNHLDSTRSVTPVPSGRPAHEVDVWRWTVTDSAAPRLVPGRVERWCPASDGSGQPCTPPAILRQPRHPGGDLTWGPRLSYWSAPGNVVAEVRQDSARDRSDLYVTVEGHTVHAPIGPFGVVLAEQRLDLDGNTAFLVGRPAKADFRVMAVIEGSLVALQEPAETDVFFHEGAFLVDGDRLYGYTYVSEDPDGASVRDVFRWVQQADHLATAPVGRYCFDADGTGRLCPKE